MNRMGGYSVLLCCLLGLAPFGYADTQAQTMVQQISENVKSNIEQSKKYGTYQKIITTKYGSEGEIKQKEERIYRTIQVGNHPYNEMIQVGIRNLNSKEKAEERKRYAEFIQKVNGKSNSCGIRKELEAIEWWNVYQRYDFALLPADRGAAYVLSFKPKQIRLPEKSRFERVLNQLSGTLWVDKDFNVLRAEAKLTNQVKFGLGVLANIEAAEIQYNQQRYGDVWLPASLTARWSARIALVHHESQELRVTWYDPYSLPGDTYQAAEMLGSPGVQENASPNARRP